MNRIEALRKILADKQFGKVEGVMVDTFSASTILLCYDNGSAKVRKMIEDYPLEKVSIMCYRVTRSKK